MKNKVQKIKFLIMDVDGTLTDGKIYMGANGEVAKAFNIKDGCGIHDVLIPSGIIPVIITGRQSEIVVNRCKELGIEQIYQGVRDKAKQLRMLSSDFSTMAYIGDDINDLSCMNLIKNAGGMIGCPKDAVQEVIDIADYVTNFTGGNGAVREFIEWILG